MNKTATPLQTYDAYLFDQNGNCDYKSKTVISFSSEAELKTKFFDYVSENIEKSYEIRFVDSDDYTVFQIKNKELIFPLLGRLKAGNRWFSEFRTFINKEDFVSAETKALIKRVNKPM